MAYSIVFGVWFLGPFGDPQMGAPVFHGEAFGWIVLKQLLTAPCIGVQITVRVRVGFLPTWEVEFRVLMLRSSCRLPRHLVLQCEISLLCNYYLDSKRCKNMAQHL